jgi:predicted metalloprotease with PDZ domain
MNRRAAAVSACAAGVVIAIAWREHVHYNAPPPPVPTRAHHAPSTAPLAEPRGYSGIHFDANYKVESIEPGSPASHADLRVGDTVTAIDGIEITSGLDGLMRAPPGTVVKLGLERGVTVPIVLATPPVHP